MKPTQAEFLLRMAENTYADNDELMAEMRRQMLVGAKRILDDEEFLMKAWEINQRDKARFAQYMPVEERQRLATSQMGQATTSRSLADQRAALVQGGRDEAQAQKEQRPAANQRS